ncbi:MAG: hypothetical protein EP297_15320 [Gammaproteobacteria bacterium]|nr:MAG: hypothetical protein EP297_15320 [Gammaproteobacteria bacterium]
MNTLDTNTEANFCEGVDTELEELVLKESLVSAMGLRADNLQVGIKGDPSLRDTIFERKKYTGPVDEIYDRLEPNLEDMMLHRSIYRLYIGFNSGEIRTCSVFDPLREEVHNAEKLCDPAYVDRHFPHIEYEEKVQGIRDIYKRLRESELFNYVPHYWKNIMVKRANAWNPIKEKDIPVIMQTLQKLRALEEFYLRNITICIVQHVVRLQFNCDGTQLIDAENYRQFLEENLG